jgi:allantoate deiminase
MNASIVLNRCDILARFSEEPGQITRRYGTPALRNAGEQLQTWMESAGMHVRRDSVGNLIGRYEAATPGARTIILGSHYDSVRDAGRYDGPLGILTALACIERLHAQQQRLPITIELAAFADEEGVRYRTAYLGSSVLAGVFRPAALALRDAENIRLEDAIRAFGGDPERIAHDQRARADLIGYVEVHIEQGPVLEVLGLPVGVVTAIAAQSRLTVIFSGVAGHAGTVPMQLRHDALCAAAEFVLAVEQYAAATDGLVATVGQLLVAPGASNVIPGRVTLNLDVRHPHDTHVAAALHALQIEAERIAVARGSTLTWQLDLANGAVPCSAGLIEQLAHQIGNLGYPVHRLPSGAGHDAVVLTNLTDVAMLFVRCAGGISHNPAESVTAEDVDVAIDVLAGFLAAITS